MTRRFIIVFVLGLSSLSWASDLVPALRQGNTHELLRLGSQRGASRLAPDILGEERPLALAAIRASLGAQDAFLLLGDLAEVAARPDRSVALAAVEVAAEIAQRADPGILEQEEIRDAQLVVWHGAWFRIASDVERWVDLRVYAFETAARLHELIHPTRRPPLDLSPLLAEEQAELRAAVLTLSPPHLNIRSEALKLFADDPSDAVALSAGQVLCGPVGLPPEPLARLSEKAVDRLVRLAGERSYDIAARADLGPCLAAHPSPTSLRALAALTKESPPMLRPSLRALRREP